MLCVPLGILSVACLGPGTHPNHDFMNCGFQIVVGACRPGAENGSKEAKTRHRSSKAARTRLQRGQESLVCPQNSNHRVQTTGFTPARQVLHGHSCEGEQGFQGRVWADVYSE